MRLHLVPVLCLIPMLGSSQEPAAEGPKAPAPPDPVATMVGRLELDRYKATIKSLTAFGDRRQGTDRNRAALDWIEAQLKSYGCTNTERILYDYQPPAVVEPAPAAVEQAEGAATRRPRSAGWRATPRHPHAGRRE
jgi:hypothetical protein